MGFVVKDAAPKCVSVDMLVALLSVICYNCYITPLECAAVFASQNIITTWDHLGLEL
jgi:hypothetical protein